MYLPHYSAYQKRGVNQKLPATNCNPAILSSTPPTPPDPSTIHHVAMWMGNNQVVEARNSGTLMKISTMSWNGCIGAVRPGG